MKKLKTQKGITLIALIITIIVLLILAVVAIGAVQDDGIIQYAKNARTEYQAAQTNEQTLLDNYLSLIDTSIKDEKEKVPGLTKDGEFTPWDDLLIDGIISVSDGVLSSDEDATGVLSGILVIPSGQNITTINSHALEYSDLTSVVLPEGLININMYAFEGCENLASIVIPNTVARIDSCAFMDCTSLTEVTIPASVTYIDSAFNGCTGLTSVIFEETSNWYEYNGDTNDYTTPVDLSTNELRIEAVKSKDMKRVLD